ncbi:MAG: phage holin, LLH family [Cellulosilyticaceae bacterium]
MNDFIFELLKLSVMVLGVVVTYKVIPWIKAKTTTEQRKEAAYWIEIAVQVAEQVYKDKGQGTLKKEYVLEWLNKNGIKITAGQSDILIDLIVNQFNGNRWCK